MLLRKKWGLFAPLIWCTSAGAGVTVTADVGGVQKGNTITFTATTDESDPVVKVTFTYEGTANSDEDTTSPYQIAKTMDWATIENLTVTATFDFQSIGDQQDTVDVDVVDITLVGSTQPPRGATAQYWAFTAPSGLSVSTWDWTYDSAHPDVNWTDTADSNYYSRWYGTIAISGTIDVSATILGVSCNKGTSIAVANRGGGTWVTPIECVEDNDPNWGSPPYPDDIPFGALRDKDSDVFRIIVPQTSQDDWSDGVTLSQAASGPNAGIWYVSSNTLEVDMETVINQFIKSGGPPPVDGEDTFYAHNNAAGGCLEGDMADFVQAVKNHEYRGTPPTAKSLEGHFGRIEYEFYKVTDPAAAIESLTAGSEAALESLVNGTIELIEADLVDFTKHGTWSTAGPNWGGTGSLGSGKHARYDDWEYEWTGCDYGPENF